MRICSILYGAFLSIILLNFPAQALQIPAMGDKDTLNSGQIRNLDSFDSDWTENARLGVLKFSECAAALVSADGLAVTTASCLRSLETWIRPSDTLFVAHELSQEKSLAGLKVRQLVNLQKINNIQDAATQSSNVDHIDVIATEDSSIFWEYSWKIYDDVRLVLIPPIEISKFGNLDGVYPRHTLDFALFRVYDENRLPLDTENYFAWSDRAPYVREALYIPVIKDNDVSTKSTLTDTFDYNGTTAPPFTTLFGMLDLYHSHGGDHHWTLPPEWISQMRETDLSSVLNFSVAGECPQYGGPIIDVDMEIVGVLFDTVYPEQNTRCAVVSTSAIIELVEAVFNAEYLAEELAQQMREGDDQYE